MGAVIEVDDAVIARAQRGWDSAADRMCAAVTGLDALREGGLAPGVVQALDWFAGTWRAQLVRLGTTAQHNADAFGYTWCDFRFSDLAQAERVRSLLPWSERDDRVRLAVI